MIISSEIAVWGYDMNIWPSQSYICCSRIAPGDGPKLNSSNAGVFSSRHAGY